MFVYPLSLFPDYLLICYMMERMMKDKVQGDLLYVPEHLACRYYGNCYPYIFRTASLKKDEKFHDGLSRRSFVLFLMRGSLQVTCSSGSGQMQSGEMKHICRSCKYMFHALTDCEMLICETVSDLSLCSQFTLDNLNAEVLEVNEVKNYISLKICDNLWEMLVHFKTIYEAGLRCLHYQKLKRDEMFLYLRAYYTKHDLALFFHDFLGEDHSFKHYVLSNVDECATLEELIAGANMSRSTFIRRFKEIFKDTPSKWMLQRKALNVIRDIRFTTVPFSELSEKFKFSSPAYFTTFCKKNFGKTPQQLRDEQTD